MHALVFDLDDTLVITDARVIVRRGGSVLSLRPSEFTVFERLPGDEMDFSQFDDPSLLAAGRIVADTASILVDGFLDGVPVAIVTARGNADVVGGFLRDALGVSVPPSLLHAVSGYPGDTVPEKKAEAFRRLSAQGLREFSYYEDCRRNLRAAQEVCGGLGCRVVPHLVEAGPPVVIHRFDGRTPP